MRLCAFNTGPDFHLLDHIGPLAHFLKMPLFVEEEVNFTISRHYYPMVKTKHFPDIEHHFKFLAENFDVLYECKYWQPHLKRLFKDFYQKDMRLVFCAHGQSDKGYNSPLLDPYSTQDACLIYGQLLKNMLNEMGISANCIYTGNYRLHFYLKHKKFYDQIAEKEVFSRFKGKQQILLYAPTWEDADGASSFFSNIEGLCSCLPDHINLLVKVHPLLEQRDPSKYYRLAHLVEQKSNRILVSDFPPVYPLLSQADAYLGDYSSVGYDFLYFKKPMFFLLKPEIPKGKLHECGMILNSVKDLFEHWLKNPFQERQEKLYNRAFTFQEETNPDGFGEDIHQLGNKEYLFPCTDAYLDIKRWGLPQDNLLEKLRDSSNHLDEP